MFGSSPEVLNYTSVEILKNTLDYIARQASLTSELFRTKIRSMILAELLSVLLAEKIQRFL